ncbi:MotB family protein [Agrobacterium larrymoorei]|uniref:MotB family protein n=1 Tax=Agrobacterium larrymoorei TaxID=160699 RepID=A0AAF0KD52_9HYPH|nr:MotB family protein [Agrobacterium larrymoorei]WHA40825.1 MotB family protein [Agrobacterium larrymoorei]
MSESENHHHGKNEIIIVKRHKGGHDGAHGGAWKIAYADFMTAMMAFFLVMWLVNASNEETKASVASYFNPIKLTDEKPAERGLKQPAKTAKGEENQQKSETKAEKPREGDAAASGQDMTSSSGENVNYSEQALFENPYAVLAEIAQEVGQQANISVKGEGGAAESGPATGASGGEAYRDPFDPDFWSKQVDVPNQPNAISVQDTSLPEKAPKPQDAKATAQKQDVAGIIGDPNDLGLPPNAKAQATAEVSDDATDAQDAKPVKVAAATPQAKPDVAPAKPDAQAKPSQAQDKTAKELRDEISQQVAGVAGKLAEGIVVTPAEGGTLITISEKASNAMFDVGSAVPQRNLVLAMAKIGEVLSKQQGAVVIRGHTDGRAYNSGGKDNWTLSMDRAHAAYYMLVRGGLDETRIKQLSGFADRRLQSSDDPLNGANRRIEILLEDG